MITNNFLRNARGLSSRYITNKDKVASMMERYRNCEILRDQDIIG
jgi:hypothetical protein